MLLLLPFSGYGLNLTRPLLPACGRGVELVAALQEMLLIVTFLFLITL
jgi:hypothetical protein